MIRLVYLRLSVPNSLENLIVQIFNFIFEFYQTKHEKNYTGDCCTRSYFICGPSDFHMV